MVTRDAQLVVRAPRALAGSAIDAFIRKKSAWIARKQEQARCRTAPPKTFIDGEEFLYLGRPCRLALVDGSAIALTDRLEFPRRYLSRAAAHMKAWYKRQAAEKIAERVRFYAETMGLACPRSAVTHAESRWGSCGPGGTVNFSWRLIMAPVEVIDYVVVHELAHLVVRNHSRAFWRKVALVMPGHALYRKWLRENDHLLSV